MTAIIRWPIRNSPCNVQIYSSLSEVLDVEFTVRVGAIPGLSDGLLARKMQDVRAEAFGGLDLESGETRHGHKGFRGTRSEKHDVVGMVVLCDLGAVVG